MNDLNLKKEHYQDLKKSGLSDETIRAHDFQSLNNKEIKSILGRSDVESAYLIKYPGPNNKYLVEYYRIKPTVPVYNEEKKTYSKYLSRKNSGCRLYVPWPVWEICDNHKEPLLITEGEKKALKATQEGFNCIAISGVTCAHKKDTNQEFPLDDFDWINLENRYVYIVFDGDKASNTKVLDAQFKLGKSLTKKKGAKVRIINLPIQYKLDDYLIDKGFDSLKNLTLNHYENFSDYLSNPNCRYQQARIVCYYLKIIYSEIDDNYYQYESGVYKIISEASLQKKAMCLLQDDLKHIDLVHILKFIKTIRPISKKQFNSGDRLNLKNGLFHVTDYTLIDHSEKEYSTIQLNVNYKPEAKCDLWIKTLNEVMEYNNERIQTFQEFFGLCLTKENKYEKSLFLVGDGANGKSTVLHIIRAVLSLDNISSIALEDFGNNHYIADLSGKLVNLSLETKAKSEVFDSRFKAIVTGDLITADQKYKAPISFNPFCKLIIATNNLPRVEDKTSAFFRRLLIIPFNVTFTPEKADVNLKFKLEKEIDGIFLWALEGLKRLRLRGYFEMTKELIGIIKQYQENNNSVMSFVEDVCIMNECAQVTKKSLYNKYKEWCNENGHRLSSSKSFSKNLKQAFNEVGEDKIGIGHVWLGIDINPLR